MISDFESTGETQRKIDIYYKDARGLLYSCSPYHWCNRIDTKQRWVYACSTNHWRTCGDARQHWANIHTNGDTSIVMARFSE